MRAVTVALGVMLFACAGDPETVAAPIDAPATVADARAAGWTFLDVSLAEGRGQRQDRVAFHALVTMDVWRGLVLRARAAEGVAAPTMTVTLDVHTALAQVDDDGRVTRTITNRFDGGAARAAFVQGRRVLALVTPDELMAGAWRVWHAYALTADGTLAESAMELPRGADPAPVFAP